jgi:hypothetical protein
MLFFHRDATQTNFLKTSHASKQFGSSSSFGLINAGSYMRDYRKAKRHNSQVEMNNRYGLKRGRKKRQEQDCHNKDAT